MKICQVIASDVPKVAGLEKHVIELSNELAEDDSIDLYLIGHSSYEKYLTDNVNFIELDLTKSRFNIMNYIKLLIMFRKYKFNIIHAQANKASYIVSKIRNFLSKTKLIATIHNTRNKNINIFNTFDKVIGVSKESVKNIKADKTVIYNGIDMPKYRDIDICKEFKFKSTVPLIVSVGRLVYAKGFDNLIQAAKEINANFLIIGDGPLENDLKNMVDQLSLNDKILFAGFKTNVYDYVNKADLVLIPSRNEGFPYVFVETMLLNKPIVSTDMSDIAAFIHPKYLVKVDDISDLKEKTNYALEDLNRTYDDYNQYFKYAKEKLTLKNMASETKNEYYHLIK